MTKVNYENFDKLGTILFKYKRGSSCQGTFIEGVSDIDTAAVYLAPTEQLLGLGFDYQEQVNDEKNDNVAYEFGKFMRLLLKSNPTILEMLFVDDEFIEYEHPIFTELKSHRDKFVTKECFDPFGGYAVSQIKKCRSLNKKMLQSEERNIEEKAAIDFCYTSFHNGSTHLIKWLENRGLKPEFCGVTKVPNMHNIYNVFYDWNAFFNSANGNVVKFINFYQNNKETSENEILDSSAFKLGKYLASLDYTNNEQINRDFELHYRGIFKNNTSTEVRLSSVESKTDKPICQMYFNQEGFSDYLKRYTEFLNWKKNRNPQRYAQNKGKNYDAKNVSQAFRLINMCTEIANGEGVKINRRNIDRDFILDVKQHKYSYEEVISLLDEKKAILDKAIANSNIQDSVDIEFVNNFLIEVRKKQLGII